MHVIRNDRIGKILRTFVAGGIALLLSLGTGALPLAHAQEAVGVKVGPYYTVTPVTLSDGTLLKKTTINGPPTPPPGFEAERQPVALPMADSAAGVNILTEVPAFKWVLGCSAVSGAMIAGYYDRTGWPNIYTGPTNGGVMPLDDTSWPTWSDGFPDSGEPYANCPLIATHNGVDGRSTRGTIDDYWVRYDSGAPDPYIGNWTQHTWGDAIGDYMWTGQSAFENTDGSTSFWNYPDATRFNCADIATGGYADGTLGRKHFYEARGYTVTDCYNQNTDNTVAGGFSYAQLKAEIDAGRPVMLNLIGHTVVAVGYDDSSNLVYIHDTWDHNNHTMTWGGSYSGMALDSVSIVNFLSATQPTVQFGAVSSSGSEATTSAAITVALSGASAQTITVHYATANGTAMAGSDYTAVSGTLTFSPGATSQMINVPVINDAVHEGDETFTVTLTSPTNATLGAITTHTYTIIDDDAAPSPGTIQLSASAYAVNENGGSVTITATRTSGSSGAVGISYATSNGTATAGSDYTATSGTLSWADGVSAVKTFSVTIANDSIYEGDETFSVTLSSPTGGATLGSPSSATVTIVDDEAEPTVQFSSASSSGSEATTPAAITIALSGASAQTVTVHYATANGTATAGSDYTATSGTLTFSPGVTSRTINVTVINDAIHEGDETFTVTLTIPTNATLGATTTHTYTIIDDDAAPSPGMLQLSAAAYSVNENGGSITITATRTGGSVGAVGIGYATSNGTATAGSDYTATSGTLSWADGVSAGKTFTVPIISDNVVEGNETFTITLSSPTGGATLGSPSSATVTIIDSVDTQPPVNGTLVAVAGPGQVRLTWSGFSDSGSGIDSYKLVYATGTPPSSCSSGSPLYTGTDTGYLQTGLSKGITYYYRVCASDKSGNMSSGATASARIAVAPLVITTITPLAAGTYGANYNKKVAATGGYKPYTWSVISGALPAGVTLYPTNGALKGKPTGWGDFNFTVQVTDKLLNTATKEMSMTILVPPLVISTTTLASGKHGSAYNRALKAKGGVLPYAWSIASGSLPNGLTLDSATGIISGVPVSAGSYNVTIQLMDGRSEAITKDFILVVK